MPQATVSRMRHRATIQRDQAAGTDDWGGAPAPNFQNLATDVKCFGWSRTRQEKTADDKTIVIEDIHCIMPLSTDVTEEDRLSSITDRQGTTVLAGPLEILAVQRHMTHLELTLRRISG